MDFAITRMPRGADRWARLWTTKERHSRSLWLALGDRLVVLSLSR
jgi:hypothetical protein